MSLKEETFSKTHSPIMWPNMTFCLPLCYYRPFDMNSGQPLMILHWKPNAFASHNRSWLKDTFVLSKIKHSTLSKDHLILIATNVISIMNQLIIVMLSCFTILNASKYRMILGSDRNPRCQEFIIANAFFGLQ